MMAKILRCGLIVALLAGIGTATLPGSDPVQIKTGKAPNFLRLAPGGKQAVVTAFGSDQLSVIRLDNWTEGKRVDAGYGPLGLAFSVDGGSLYVTNMTSGLVKDFQYPSLNLQDTYKIGHTPTDIAVTPDGYYFLVANFGKGKWGSLDVFDLQRKRVTQSVKVGVKPLAIAVSPNGEKAYVANSASNTLSVVSLEVYKAVETIPVGDGPNGLALSKNGRKLFITHSRSDDLWVYDLRRGVVLNKIALPAGPFRIAVSPDEKLLAVPCYRAGQLAVLDWDMSAGSPVRRIQVRKNPVDAAFTSDGTRILVTCEGDDRVVVVPAGQ